MKHLNQLNKKNIEDVAALTPLQEGMLFHYLKTSGSELYFEQLCMDISGEIDIKCFEQAWNFVIKTNEMLRTAFTWENVKEPVQIILNEYNLKSRYYNFPVPGGESKEERKSIHEIITGDREERFDLSALPIFRVVLCKMEADKYKLIVSNHHILYDGWSRKRAVVVCF